MFVSTLERVAALLKSGYSQTEIARALGISKPTVCHHVRRLGIPAKLKPSYDWNAIRAYYEAGHSAGACRAKFGFSRSAWDDAIQRGAIVPRPRGMPIDELLSAPRKRAHLKLRLTAEGLLADRCQRCGISAWLGGRLSLELHHINGDGQDNRLENLQILCPNCHSQTDSWGGKNRSTGRNGSNRSSPPPTPRPHSARSTA
jgi:5-methylcytosine-specific restriction endonuclease McrA